MLAIILSLALLLGCAAAGTAEESEAAAYRIGVKTFPVYFGDMNTVWREDFPLYFVNDAEDLPFVELNDWADVLNLVGPALAGRDTG